MENLGSLFQRNVGILILEILEGKDFLFLIEQKTSNKHEILLSVACFMGNKIPIKPVFTKGKSMSL